VEGLGDGDVCLNAVIIMHSLSVLFSLSAPALIDKKIKEFDYSQVFIDCLGFFNPTSVCHLPCRLIEKKKS